DSPAVRKRSMRSIRSLGQRSGSCQGSSWRLTLFTAESAERTRGRRGRQNEGSVTSRPFSAISATLCVLCGGSVGPAAHRDTAKSVPGGVPRSRAEGTLRASSPQSQAIRVREEKRRLGLSAVLESTDLHTTGCTHAREARARLAEGRHAEALLALRRARRAAAPDQAARLTLNESEALFGLTRYRD